MYLTNCSYWLLSFKNVTPGANAKKIKDKIKINQDVNSQEKEMSTFNQEEHQDDMIWMMLKM